MARALSGTSQYLSRTNPTGISVNAAWTFIANMWVNSSAVNQTILLVGTPTTLTRGFAFAFEDTNRYMMRIGTDSFTPAGATMGSGAWRRLSVSHGGSGDSTWRVAVDGTQIFSSAAGWSIPEINSSDDIRFGDTNGYLYYGDLAGKFAWSAWVQGTAISVANADTYAQNPCNLITDYGTSGAITANALKGLWPFQPGNPGQDISGVGNDLTDTSTTDTADPSGYPTSCGGGGGGGVGPNTCPFEYGDIRTNPAILRDIARNPFRFIPRT